MQMQDDNKLAQADVQGDLKYQGRLKLRKVGRGCHGFKRSLSSCILENSTGRIRVSQESFPVA